MDENLFLQSGKFGAAIGVPPGFSSGATGLPKSTGREGQAIAATRCLWRRQAGRTSGRYGTIR